MIRDASALLITALLAAGVAQARPGEYSAKESYAKGGGDFEGGYKFTDDVILPSGGGGMGPANLEYGKSAEDLDIPHINLEEHQASMENEKATIGSGFHDIGPKDVGQEIFAKMEEAAQHAMTIVEGAQKFTEEAAKEQAIKGDAKGAYQDQLSLSPDHVHVDSKESGGAPAAPAAPTPSGGDAGQPMPPSGGGQPAPPSSDKPAAEDKKPY